MELNRLGRAVADRWVVVALIAVLGVAGALVFTMFANRNQDPLFQATAAFRFIPVEGETIPDLAEPILEAQDFAIIAADELLTADPNSLIVADLADARLQFIAQGSTAAQATDKARALQQSFLEIDPTLGGAVDDLLVELEVEAKMLLGQIDEYQFPPTPEDEKLIEDIAFIDLQIGAINTRLVDLVLVEAGASSEEQRQAVALERSSLTQTLSELAAERVALGEPATPQLSVEDELLLATLQARMESLRTEYQRLYLRKLGVTGSGTIEPLTVADITPEPGDPLLNASIGLVGGILIAVAAVLFVTRTRRTVWLPEDIRLPVLAQVPARRVGSNAAEVWYDQASPGARKVSIQALRPVVQAQLAGSGATLALTRHRTESEQVQALATDLATSIASAGSSVLLIDANFESRSALGEYKVGGPSLSGVLELNPDLPEFTARMEDSVDNAYLVRRGLSVIPAGPPPESGADALAGVSFRELIAVAKSRYDLVIVVVDDIGSPSAHVAMQRVDHGILVLTPGNATVPMVDGLLNDAARLKISLLGVVFLGKLERMASLVGGGSSRPTRPSQPRAASGTPEKQPSPVSTSPISRLNTYAVPDERRSAVVPHDPLADLAGQVGLLRRDDGLGHELVSALRGIAPDQAHEAVAEYLVSRTEDMISAQFGYGDLSNQLIEQVSEYGFLTLRPLRDHQTVAHWLGLEIDKELDEGAAAEVVDEMERALAMGPSSGGGIDEWLDENFFRKHTFKTGGEPYVWHLASLEGTVSVLIPAQRLDQHRIEILIRDLASNEIDELERYRKAAVTRGDLEQAAIFERQVVEVGTFKAALESLTGAPGQGRRSGGKAWLPDWSLGIRPNMAPLQGAGLFPFDVLTEDELYAVQAGP